MRSDTKFSIWPLIPATYTYLPPMQEYWPPLHRKTGPRPGTGHVRHLLVVPLRPKPICLMSVISLETIRYHSGLSRLLLIVASASRWPVCRCPSSIAIDLISPYKPCLDETITDELCSAVMDCFAAQRNNVPLLRFIISGASALAK